MSPITLIWLVTILSAFVLAAATVCFIIFGRAKKTEVETTEAAAT